MDFAEIKAAVEKQPELITEITSSFKDQLIKGMQAEGLIIRSKEDDQSFLENHVKNVVDGKVAEALRPAVAVEFGKSMGVIDTELKSISGIEKNNGEKTTDYAKRVMEALKAKGGDPVTRERITQLEQQLEASKKEATEKLTALQNSTFEREIDIQINSDLDKRSYAIPGHLKTDKEKQEYVSQEKEMIKQALLAKFRPKRGEDGAITFYENDKPLLNIKDGTPMNASGIIGDKYASRFIPATHTQTGTGTGQQGESGTGGKFKTIDDIHKHLAAQGVAAGTKEYTDQYTTLLTENKL